MNSDAAMVVAILLFDEVEVLDFAGPYEVFSVACDESGAALTTTLTVSQRGQVRCRGGLRVITDITFSKCPPLHALIVPGGPGTRDSSDDSTDLIKFIQERASLTQLVGSVCTGSFLLAQAGLLDGRKATTHPARREHFAAEFPTVDVVASKIVDEGCVITAAGVSSGIDLALYLLEKWFGTSAREREAKRLDGPW